LSDGGPRPFSDRPAQIRWFAWLSETARTSGVNLTHESVKERVLHVEHLAEWRGTVAEAQKAVLDYVEQALRDAGNPEQLGFDNLLICPAADDQYDPEEAYENSYGQDD